MILRLMLKVSIDEKKLQGFQSFIKTRRNVSEAR